MSNISYEKYTKRYQKTPKGRFWAQRAGAKRRGIPWELTFEQWWKVWEESGKWEERGTGSGQYCMARIHGEGPYAADNVRIRTMRSNSKKSYLRSTL